MLVVVSEVRRGPIRLELRGWQRGVFPVEEADSAAVGLLPFDQPAALIVSALDRVHPSVGVAGEAPVCVEARRAVAKSVGVLHDASAAADFVFLRARGEGDGDRANLSLLVLPIGVLDRPIPRGRRLNAAGVLVVVELNEVAGLKIDTADSSGPVILETGRHVVLVGGACEQPLAVITVAGRVAVVGFDAFDKPARIVLQRQQVSAGGGDRGQAALEIFQVHRRPARRSHGGQHALVVVCLFGPVAEIKDESVRPPDDSLVAEGGVVALLARADKLGQFRAVLKIEAVLVLRRQNPLVHRAERPTVLVQAGRGERTVELAGHLEPDRLEPHAQVGLLQPVEAAQRVHLPARRPARGRPPRQQGGRRRRTGPPTLVWEMRRRILARHQALQDACLDGFISSPHVLIAALLGKPAGGFRSRPRPPAGVDHGGS